MPSNGKIARVNGGAPPSATHVVPTAVGRGAEVFADALVDEVGPRFRGAIGCKAYSRAGGPSPSTWSGTFPADRLPGPPDRPSRGGGRARSGSATCRWPAATGTVSPVGLPRETPSDVRHRGDRPARARQRGRRAGTRGRRHGRDVAAPWSRRRGDLERPAGGGRPVTPPARGRRARASGGAAHALTQRPLGDHLQRRALQRPVSPGPPGAGGAHIFSGTSDTEVLVVGLDRWGLDETLDRMEGMFAFGAWDAASRTLHLARDRFGEKPLFYGWTGGRLRVRGPS